MDKAAILNIIESTLKSGSKTPGLFDLPKILSIKSEIESCHSINGVLGIIEQHRDLLAKAFGLNEAVIESAVQKLKALEG
jgi:hypothetical protein